MARYTLPTPLRLRAPEMRHLDAIQEFRRLDLILHRDQVVIQFTLGQMEPSFYRP
jgi:hypothetical protein